MGGKKERTERNLSQIRLMRTEMQNGIEKNVPETLTPLEEEILKLFNWMPLCFATTEEFDAVFERHKSKGKKPSEEQLLNNFIAWGYVEDTTSPTRPGFIPQPSEFSITSFGSRRAEEIR